MAMTKAEKAHLENVETQAALRWPSEMEPTPLSKQEIEDLKVTVTPKDTSVFGTRGCALVWSMVPSSGCVRKMWHDGYLHGHGWTGDGGSRSAINVYRTEDEAYCALRWAMCRNFARELRRADINRFAAKGNDA